MTVLIFSDDQLRSVEAALRNANDPDCTRFADQVASEIESRKYLRRKKEELARIRSSAMPIN